VYSYPLHASGASCDHSLTQGQECTNKSTLYCRTCYNKKFGTRGYGFGGGAGVLTETGYRPLGKKMSVANAFPIPGPVRRTMQRLSGSSKKSSNSKSSSKSKTKKNKKKKKNKDQSIQEASEAVAVSGESQLPVHKHTGGVVRSEAERGDVPSNYDVCVVGGTYVLIVGVYIHACLCTCPRSSVPMCYCVLVVK
jgi:hypothetical protein